MAPKPFLKFNILLFLIIDFSKKTLGTDHSRDEDLIIGFCKESNKIKEVGTCIENLYVLAFSQHSSLS